MAKEKEIGLKEILEADKFPDIAALGFEKGMKILEELVQGVETGSFPLDKSIRAYERGATLMAHLRQQLEGAEQKLKLVKP